MKRFTYLFCGLLVITVIGPISLFAQGPTTPGYLIVCNGPDCTFNDLVTLGVHLINYLILLSSALAAVSFAYAGFLFMSSGGSEGQVTKAKEVMKKTAIGFMWVLAAWIVVNTIVGALVKNDPAYFLIHL